MQRCPSKGPHLPYLDLKCDVRRFLIRFCTKISISKTQNHTPCESLFVYYIRTSLGLRGVPNLKMIDAQIYRIHYSSYFCVNSEHMCPGGLQRQSGSLERYADSRFWSHAVPPIMVAVSPIMVGSLKFHMTQLRADACGEQKS